MSIINLLQTMRDWHLVMIVLLVTGVGVLLVTIKTGVQYSDPPVFVRDKEDPEGRTVRQCPHHLSWCENIGGVARTNASHAWYMCYCSIASTIVLNDIYIYFQPLKSGHPAN